MTPPTDLLSSIGICVSAAALLAVVGWRLRQPLILAYLLTGVVIGPNGLRWVPNQESISTVAEIGLILLLFVIGLEIDLKKLAPGLCVFGLVTRSKEYLTSVAVSSRPLLNLTPWRRWKV